MSGWEIGAIAAAVLISFAIIHKIMGSARPLSSAIASVSFGVFSLIAVDLCSAFTAVYIPISQLSMFVAAVLGIPGVTMLLILQMML